MATVKMEIKLKEKKLLKSDIGLEKFFFDPPEK